MWPVPAPTTLPLAATSSTAIAPPDSFFKDGRKIHVGDCALFKPPQDSPPFIGVIRRLILGNEDNISLCVNWLYRPADVKLGKGVLLEAAPNEVFYSFHKDEIPSASLLHPCKVSFLRKGVELPSGISSFVCRRVYDIDNKCLWWLTDQDYINGRQEEVNKLLDKTRSEMYGAVQSGGRSPKPLNGPTGTPQLKPSSDGEQNTSSSSSQVKGKKRELAGQVSDTVKRERSEHMLKSEIAKITDKGGLVDFVGVEKLVQLMQPEGTEKKIDFGCRIMLVDVIAATDRFDCLGRFVQLRGLPVLDEWLQEVHKRKIGDVSSPKESDKSVEEFLLALLRALDKLPVNLHALQTCNVGKSVNHLRTHKNSEIAKKARSLVDTWKKRVEAEMNMIDSKPGSTRGGSWPNKSLVSEVSHSGTHRTGGSAEVDMKGSGIQSCSSKSPPAKLGSGDVAKFSAASPGSTKLTAPVITSVVSGTKDLCSVTLVGAGSSDLPLSKIKEEKSSNSSQSQNNSQSCSSGQGKTTGASCREDARSSTAGSMSVNKISSGASRTRKSSNGLHGSAVSGVQKESSFGKVGSLNKNLASEKGSPTRVTSERVPDVPFVDNGINQRLIVRFPNTGRSPARSASGGSLEDVSATFCKGTHLVHSQKLDHRDRKVKAENDNMGTNGASNVKIDFCHGKDGLDGSDEVNVSSTGVFYDERSRDCEVGEKLTEASKATGSSFRITNNGGKSYEASFSSINALVESCVKFSEACESASVGDDIGMNLLASVAAGEMSRTDVSPLGSPGRKSPLLEESCSGNDVKLRQRDEDRAHSEDQLNDRINGGAAVEKGGSVETLVVNGGFQHHAIHVATNVNGDSKVTSFGCDVKIGDDCVQSNSSSMDLRQNGNGPLLFSQANPNERIQNHSAATSAVDATKEGNAENQEADQVHELRMSGTSWTASNIDSNAKHKSRSPSSDEDKNIGYAGENSIDNKVVVVPDPADTSAKVKTGTNEDSTSCSGSDICGEDKKTLHKQSGGSILMERMTAQGECGESQVTAPAIGSRKLLGPDLKAEGDGLKSGNETEWTDKQNMELGSSISVHISESALKTSEKKEVLVHHRDGLAPHKESPTRNVQEIDQSMKLSECKLDGLEAEEPASRVCHSVSGAGSDTTVKLDFDLNEGLPVDDGCIGDLGKVPAAGNSSSVLLPAPLPISIPSMSGTGSLPASITVAAAAKGPFVLPENPLRSVGELGWKGSAATSAFRPTEPKKVLEIPVCATDVALVNSSSKQGRPLLDFDLNVADERLLDDASQNPSPATFSESGSRDRSGGGLNLDLNRCDESSEVGQFSVSNSCGFEIPKFPGRSPLSGGFSIAESNTSRDFDLNNGPVPDEPASETAQHLKSSMPYLSSVRGVRLNNMELGNFSSWFSPGNSYSAIGIPPILPGRGEQIYPIVPAAASQRILVPPTGSTSFGPEMYRGPVLSSSPAVPFPPTTPFQYPGFPFETNFPVPSSSYSGCSTAYVDSLSGGPVCFPPIPSQLVGTTGMVSTHYPQPPYGMSLPGGTSNVGPESRRWASMGLDLNAGPGGTDAERRDERLPSALRQLPVAGSQGLADEQLKMYHQMAGGLFKRKEPDGGWDGDRMNYKHPSWQ